MIRVALCDDEQTEVVKTHKMLIGYGKSHRDTDFDIGIFKSAEQLLAKVREGYTPDIILMDIYMGTGQTGIDAARELRAMGIRSRIIFLTSSEQHALEAFRVEAAQYLVKPVADAELFSLLDKLLEILDDEKQKYIVLVADNRTFRVMVQDIVYCESQGKRQYLYMADGTQICVRMTMTVLEELFTAYGEIIRIGKWYIITCQQYFSGHMALLHCAGTAAQSEEDGADRCRRNTKPIMHLLPNISKEIWTSL